MPRHVGDIAALWVLHKNNPSYVLMRGNDGHTFAKFVGTNYDDYAWTIWVPKTLIANSLGPIAKWGPKIKA